MVEGPDGAGKTDLCAGDPETNFQGLTDTLSTAYDLEVVLLREPGGCELSEHLRGILKGWTVPGALSSYRAEALLFAAARAQLVEEVVRPALERGAWVVLDRFIGSSVVYQGLARGLSVADIKHISAFATSDLHVDRVLALQVSPEVSSARRRERDGATGDRIEESTSASIIRDGYADLKHLDPHEVVEVCADGSREETLALCVSALADLLPSAPSSSSGSTPTPDRVTASPAIAPAAAADKAVLSWLKNPSLSSFRFRAKALARHYRLPLTDVEAALERAADTGRLERTYEVRCSESGQTMQSCSVLSGVPLWREVDCHDCLKPHFIEERDVLVTYISAEQATTR